ncbi:MAG: 4Fe-4S dicluster domain-containing protein [Nitrososphaerales archaeon]
MTRYAMVINLNRCIGCDVCLMVCKDQYVDNDYLPYTKAQPETGHFWMYVSEIERGEFPSLKVNWLPKPCMHCDDAPCIKSSNGSVYKRSDGIVIIDPVKSVGQLQIVNSCPYGRIYWNQKEAIPQKCTFCAHRVDQGLTPACVEACPLQALAFGDLDDPNSLVSKLIVEGKAEPLNPEYGTKPKVYYIGLPKDFISGRVVDSKGELLQGVEVTVLSLRSDKKWVTKTDRYGDFMIDGLTSGTSYSVSFEKIGFLPRKRLVHLSKSTYLGDITLYRKTA